MAIAEQPCYTLINNPNETEVPNEQQLKHDLGEFYLMRSSPVYRLLYQFLSTSNIEIWLEK